MRIKLLFGKKEEVLMVRLNMATFKIATISKMLGSLCITVKDNIIRFSV